jgi:glycolate oxidase FAD binding subunit
MQPFAAIVGAEHVRPPAGPKLADAPIEAVVEPGTADEVAACLAAARSAGVPLVVRGGGSKLHWGNPPDKSPIVLLDSSRLNAVPVLEPEEGIVSVEGGVKIDELERAASEHGARTSLPSIFPGASVGGTIAADPVSPVHSAERRARNDVLGLEVALPNGELTRAGGKVVKNVTGFDLVRLYCGSLGTLGVITAATYGLRSSWRGPGSCGEETERSSCGCWREARRAWQNSPRASKVIRQSSPRGRRSATRSEPRSASPGPFARV